MGRKITTKDFIKKARLIHEDKYNYSKVDYVKAKQNIIIICPEHGEFEQTPDSHVNQKSGCQRCGNNINSTTESFIEKARLIHGGKYNYSKVDYVKAKQNVIITCSIHGEFEQQPSNHLQGGGCGRCANNIKLTTEEFVGKLRLVHGDKYDYSKVGYVNDNMKINIVCFEHGEFEQKSGNHMRGDGCPKCSGHFMDTEYFIEKAKKVHGDKYDYAKVDYIDSQTKVSIICSEHGEFEQQPNNHLFDNGCPICKESKGEKTINKLLTESGIDFTPQYKFDDCRNILPLPFDFYLPEYNTCIEYQGRQHYIPIKLWGGDEALKDTQFRDNIKKVYCKKNDIPLIVIKYNENINTKLKQILVNPKT